ncbi:HlyD family efflux transporter periplasmic adaptor subunit [Sphingobacterium sp. DK4209]|uniref:HlyD family efflux transporter periplasmic adaptor subunit n=1 Tax=Sphingobacterium zhuxiongii TaxID=2662364 RepID=A0A5Q0QBW0_9SPHI|nr:MULTISPECIES: HlyD family secretion protein [unclassified Sphingobacterium]MVZ67040.1 HlyD family efflux transporter periplasmic adaptor subunit [Sphingobacterium sp. DK4209]QGA26669.1 HlyD family efflux transporter periplasmic adaptor subunit [Sphingobacterium sp. dk4302]
MSQHTTTEISPKERSRRRKIYAVNIVSILVILSAITWGIVEFFHLNESVYTEDAQVDAHINPVSAKVSGYIKEIKFREHQIVHKGDTLVVLDNEEYKIQVENALATLADARAGHDVVQTEVQIANNSLNIADANIEELKTRLNNAEVNYKRFQALMDKDAIAVYQYEQVKTEYESLLAKYKSLQAQKTNSNLSSVETQKRTAINQASIMRAQAALDLARLNLSYSVVIAPYDGVLGRVPVEEGQLIQAGQQLFAIVRDQQKWITANYTERQLKEISIGKDVQITVDAMPNRVFQGKISAISEATGSKYASIPVDNSTGNFIKVQQRIPVRIEFSKQNNAKDLEKLLVGMNVVVKAI